MSCRGVLGAFGWATALVLVGCASETDGAKETGSRKALTSAEQAEVGQAFDDAACYCEAWLLHQLIPLSPEEDVLIDPASIHVCAGDADLERYASDPARYDGIGGMRTQCTALSSSSPHGALPDREPFLTTGDRDAASLANGCILPLEVNDEDFEETFGRGSYRPGFCRADFNFCLGQELRLKADSFARAPSSRAVRDAIMQRARERFQQSAVGFASTLSVMADACTRPDDFPPHSTAVARECERLELGYGEVASSRMTDAMSQVGEVLEIEAHSRMAASDALTPGMTADGTFPDAVWGPTSDRVAAASLIMGDTHVVGSPLDLLSCSVAGLECAYAGERVGEAPFAGRWREDHRAQVALRLMLTYRMPFPHATCPTSDIWITPPDQTVPWSAAPVAWHEFVYDRLERTIYESLGNTPVPMTDRLDPALSPLRGLALAPEHIRVATDLLEDIVFTLEADYSFRPTTLPHAGPPAGCFFDTVDLYSDIVAQRPTPVFAASLARAGEGLVFPEIEPAPLPSCSTAPPTRWYDFHPDQLMKVGASGAIHILRHHLFRLNEQRHALPPGHWLQNDLINRGIDLADEMVGDSWTEYSHIYCPAEFGCFDFSTLGRGFWSVYGERFAEGGPSLVRSEEDAYCQVYGHRPGRPRDEGCGLTIGMVGLATSTPSHGRERQVFLVDSGSFAAGERAFVMWHHPGGAVEQVDVIYPAAVDGDVHAFGGSFGELFSRVMSKSAENPASPAESSLDLPYQLIPPIEHELIDDGDRFEDSFQFYIDYASTASNRAQSLLESARAHEIDMVRNDMATAAQLDAAELAQLEVVSEVCGADRATEECEVVRDSSVTVGELGLVPDPGPEPGVPPGTSCASFVANTVANFRPPSSGDAADFIRDDMRLAVECTRWLVLRGVRATELREFPVRVRQEIEAGGRGEFADTGGAVREEFIRTFRDLDDLRIAFQHLETTYRATLVNLRVAASMADDASSSLLDDILCYVGGAVAGVLQVAAGVSSIAAGGPVGIVFGAISIGSGINTFANLGDECSEGDDEADRIVLRTFAEILLAMDQISRLQDEAGRLITSLAASDARLDTLGRRVNIARARRSINEHLARSSDIVAQPAWRALQGVEARRARDALFRAQRLAFVARRAVEFRLATELRDVTVPETFTPAPASWINDVFILDTETTIASDASGSSYVLTAPEALSDHVTRLQDFVFGYPFNRRFSEGSDIQTINLSLVAAADAEEVPTDGAPSDVPLVQRMYFKCRSHPTLVRGGRLPPVPGTEPLPGPPIPPCAGTLGGVEFATYTFRIPENLTGYFGDRFAINNFNYRVNRIAVNIVGSAVIDCALSARPVECYTDGNLQYSLTQEGTVVLENFERENHAFFMEPGVIERARGLTAERVLTNPLASADRALLADYERAEWFGRPLSSVYTVTIHSRPEVVWENLEDIQVLLRYDYWTRQE